MKKKVNKTTRYNFTTYGMVIVLFILFQTLSSTGSLSSLLQGQLVPICAYIVMAISLNLTVGILGELSLGHAGFMSVGAFTGAILASSLQDSIPATPIRLIIVLIGAGVFAAIAGFLVGIPVLRLRGDYLAIVTLAFGEIIKSIMGNLYVGQDASGLHFSLLTQSFTLGDGGGMIVEGPMGIYLSKTIASFAAGFILVMVCLFVIFNLTNSKSGRAIMALRDNRIAAESVGINVTKYKLMAFVISAAMAGMAGALFATNYSTLVASKFDFNTSILVLVFVVLGGLGNIRGSIISAALLTVLPELLRSFQDYRMLIYAIVLILIMLVTNNPTVKNLFASLKQKFFAKKAASGDADGQGEGE